MESVFLKLLNMSLSATWLALAVAALRLLLKKAPRWITCLLWGIVGLRLVWPFSIESALSLIPSKEIVPPTIALSPTPRINTGIPAVNNAVNPILESTFAPSPEAAARPIETLVSAATILWTVGMAAMLLYAVCSWLRIRRQVREAVPEREGVWLCDRIDTPFILGVFRPRIYLPQGISMEDARFVIAHERAHLARRDHLWKPLGFLLLAVYWMNPFLWLAYILLCRDIEYACDEKVLRTQGVEIKKPYSQALINCSLPRKTVSACPVAFGEVGVRGRIRSVLNYKKPTLWILLAAAAVCGVVAVCFLTDPVFDPSGEYAVQKLIYSYHDVEGDALWLSWQPHIGIDNGFAFTDDIEPWYLYGRLEPMTLTKENLDDLFPQEDLEENPALKSIRKNNKAAWVCSEGGGGKVYFLRQKNGEILCVNVMPSAIELICSLNRVGDVRIPQAYQTVKVLETGTDTASENRVSLSGITADGLILDYQLDVSNQTAPITMDCRVNISRVLGDGKTERVAQIVDPILGDETWETGSVYPKESQLVLPGNLIPGERYRIQFEYICANSTVHAWIDFEIHDPVGRT